MIALQYEAIARGLKRLTQRMFNNPATLIGVECPESESMEKISAGFLKWIKLEQFEQKIRSGQAFRVLAIAPGGRIQYAVDRTYAIVPGRGRLAVWVEWNVDGTPKNIFCPNGLTEREVVKAFGAEQLRIRVNAIRVGYLQDMSDEDVIAEGVATRAEYITLWERINGPNGWKRNPLVARIGFDPVRQEQKAAARNSDPIPADTEPGLPQIPATTVYPSPSLNELMARPQRRIR